jgi:hypothetical protein
VFVPAVILPSGVGREMCVLIVLVILMTGLIIMIMTVIGVPRSR